MDPRSFQLTTLSRNAQPHLAEQVAKLTPAADITSSDVRTLCATDSSAAEHSTLVGYTSYTISNAPHQPRSRGLNVKSIYVRPEVRRQKLGRRVLGHMRQIATEEKCNAIYVNVGGNEGAKKFLERNGFEEWVGGEKKDGAEEVLMWHAVALF